MTMESEEPINMLKYDAADKSMQPSRWQCVKILFNRSWFYWPTISLTMKLGFARSNCELWKLFFSCICSKTTRYRDFDLDHATKLFLSIILTVNETLSLIRFSNAITYEASLVLFHGIKFLKHLRVCFRENPCRSSYLKVSPAVWLGFGEFGTFMPSVMNLISFTVNVYGASIVSFIVCGISWWKEPLRDSPLYAKFTMLVRALALPLVPRRAIILAGWVSLALIKPHARLCI